MSPTVSRANSDQLAAMKFDTTAPPLVTVSGGPLERGRQYGEQAATRIKRGVDSYTAQLEASELGWAEIKNLVAQFEPTIERFDPNYITEMKGIAEGAGVSYPAVVMLNARTELLKLAQRKKMGRAADDLPDGCTGVVVMPGATRDGRLIHAQNWDWRLQSAEASVVLKIQRDDGPDIITFTEAGALARAGLNSAGISITGNYLESDRDYRELGVPLVLIRRKVLEQQHIAFAMEAVYTTRKSASNNMIVSHCNGISIDFECAPDETFQVHPDRGLIVHANHFQSPVALSKLQDRGIINMPDSLYRDLRVRGIIEPHVGAVTTDTVKEALFDDFESPHAVCRPPMVGTHSNLSATVAMIVMEPELGRLQVAMLPAINREFGTYELATNVQRPNAGKVAQKIRASA